MITLLFTILSALYDNGKRFTNHTPRFIFRVIVVAIISYLEQGNFILNFLLNTAIFYAAFDYTLNIMEGRKWNYVGNTAKTDILWRKIGGWIPQLIFKIILLTITIYIQ
jgi:hypothetical protein